MEQKLPNTTGVKIHCGLFVRPELSPHLLILFDLVTQQYQRLGSELHSIGFLCTLALCDFFFFKLGRVEGFDDFSSFFIFFITKVLIMFSFSPGEFVCMLLWKLRSSSTSVLLVLQNLHHPGVVNLEQMFETPERVWPASYMYGKINLERGGVGVTGDGWVDEVEGVEWSRGGWVARTRIG